MVHTNDIVIVGDGFAAAVMAVHLLRKRIRASAITVIGPGQLGKGNAYTAISPAYRLNVREDLPIIFSEDPEHFARWAKAHIEDPKAQTAAGYFYRRNDFGRYVSELLSHELGAQTMHHIRSRVSRISTSGSQWQLLLDQGDTLNAKQVILATGNAPPTWPCPVFIEQSSSDWRSTHLIENPWPGHHLQSIAPDDDIILLGGGLTALDAINALVEQGHRGMIDVISPRALFPPSQAPWQRNKEPDWPSQISPARLVRFMRTYLPSAPTNSSEWQCAWEELRPNLNRIWQQFTPGQRQRLIKRLGWLWSLYRFRASPQTIAAYQQLQARGQFQFSVGRAKQVIACEPKVKVVLGNGTERIGDRLINCTGVASDPLLQQLIQDQYALPDPLLQAIAVDAQLKVVGPSSTWNNLWMIGPATMGSLGDVVAASAIAKQAEQLADQIKLSRLN